MAWFQKYIGRSEISQKAVVAFGILILVVLASSSIGYALEIHHVFADVDHDGHQHSDFDLCQWVQFHTAHSLVGEDPALGPGKCFFGVLVFAHPSVVISPFYFLTDSRGPPSSSLISSVPNYN